jgi:outer membrane protein assembly factor BamB
MKRISYFVGLALLGSPVLADAPQARDWPQWRGLNRNAVSSETGLLQEWPGSGPSLAWRIDGLGGGYSAPSVSDGRIFGMSYRGDQEVVWALAESNAKELWAKPLGPANRDGMPQGREGPGCTPTIDGDRLYVIGASGTLACMKVADGEIVWQRNLIEDYNGQLPTWRYNESPLVDGDKLICTPGGEDALLVALDKFTGDVIWKSKALDTASDIERADTGPAQTRGRRGGRPGGPPPGGRQRGGRFGRGGGFGRSGAAYASAIAIDHDGQRQYVQLTARALVGVAADDGQLLWRYDRAANRMGINCSTPIYHDGIVFAASAYGNGGGAVKLNTDADGTVTPEEVYFVSGMQNHHGGMIVVDDCLYGASGGNEGGFLVCIDFKSGKILWRDRQAPKGSLAFADGRLYLRAEDGELILIEPSRERFIERGRFDQPDRSESPAWTHPVIANGKLYVRDQDVLLCYDIKAK